MSKGEKAPVSRIAMKPLPARLRAFLAVPATVAFLAFAAVPAPAFAQHNSSTCEQCKSAKPIKPNAAVKARNSVVVTGLGFNHRAHVAS